MSSQPVTPRIYAAFTSPLYPPAIQAERDALRAEIEHDMTKLEALRQKEAVLRAVLVSELKSLRFNVQRAEVKIETRDWADGNPALDIDWENMKTAAEALMDCVEEIAYAETSIEDKQGDLWDEALWRKEQN